MKKQILAAVITLCAGLSARADEGALTDSLVCTTTMRVLIAKIKVSYLDDTLVHVGLTTQAGITEFSGHLVPQKSTPSTAVYKLTKDIGGAKAELEVKKVVTGFQDPGHYCPRCSVDPTFKYTATLNVEGTIYDFSDRIFSQCSKLLPGEGHR